MTTLYYSHPDFLAHDSGPGHPECADRIRAIENALAAPSFDALIRTEPPLLADIKDKIALIHSQKLIASVFNALSQPGRNNLDPDTAVSPSSTNAVLRAVGAVCDAIDKVCTDKANNAFCAIRPPGHHAEPDEAMGFCLFNNIAIAAEYARTFYQLERIAIVDFDVHHGNGTQTAFLKQPAVLYASSHQMPHYPGTGHPSETGVGNIVNVPLDSGTTGAVFREKYKRIIFPALHHFKPQLLMISAGFDAHKDDPLASIELVEDDYRWVTQELIGIAKHYAGGKIVSALEGGYNLNALAASVAIHVKTLLEA
ncbi:histone deacetylase family protein [Methylicorpusculum oleiharenae]|uniref:histone deacetylase family protein n=1 Tax=Methylicorpusculum oleiharenae TaxID=1338687 RepID=UPI001357480A|nr:histone deacetylase family protein [Methylicorpusculum oleiharenae]MCD2451511.1 histone deacetylase family protein [Methylicorpusculum oleiharenae]